VPSLEEVKQEFDKKFDALTDRAGELRERIESGSKDSEATKALSDELSKVGEEVETLTKERNERLREAEYEAMKSEVSSLTEAIKGITTDDRFSQGSGGNEGDDSPYADGEHVFYVDAAKAMKGDRDALGRWTEAVGEKAMGEGTGTTGGFLVPDQISSEILELKTEANVLRPRFSSLQVNSDTVRIAGQTQGLVAGWVAEFAEKPSADLAFGELSVNVFQKAGLAVVSNQLLKDSNRSLQGLINRDLAKRLARLEELAFIAGTGTGQPLGILNTPGVDVIDYTDASPTVVELLDHIVEAITAVHTDYFGAPDTIVMHPRTWAYIVSAREAATAQTFLVGPPSQAQGGSRGPTDRLPGYGSGQLPIGQLFGLPVYTTTVVPTNLGAADDESVVIVGRFDEGLILEREGITLDSSEHVYFTSNQTVFRGEDRVGFTASRYPEAFKVIGGTGLKGL
jgi:HK97 family phage major capsid protein